MYYRENKCSITNQNDFTCQILDWQTNKDIINEDSECSDDIPQYEIHLFGITLDKQSVHIKVINFKPFFYIEIPQHWNTLTVNRLISKINDNLKYSGKGDHIDGLIANKIVKKHKFYGFTNNELFKFVCLIFENYESFNAYKYALSRKIMIPGETKYPQKFQIYESNIIPMLRFMHLRDLESCGWIKIPAKKYSINKFSDTRCQIDITCKWRNIEKYETNDMTNIIQASFDIECTSIDGSFPQATRPGDKIIQIGTTVREYGQTGFLLKHIITLNSCSPIEGCVVESYPTEKEVILAWTRLIQKLDPDVLYGYNIFGFDYKYLYDRAKLLNCLTQFSRLSKIKDLCCKLDTKKLSSSALGDNTMYLPNLPGRISIDIMKVIQRDHNLVSYKLNSVAEHFIKDVKDDVTPAQIFAFQKGSADDRAIIAKYCIQDCALLNNLADKLNILINNIGMANVCSVPLSFIFMRGQGIKIFSLVAKYCRKENYLLPVVKKDPNIDARYEGAIVLEPQVGFHKFVSVLDYKSLYPSEMIASNLSHDTFVNNPKYDNLPGIDYKVISYKNADGTMSHSKFAKIPEKRGIVPKILLHLLAQRSKFKKLMAKEKDPFQKAVLDGVQLALKVTCNSVYGQCGASTSQIYLKDVAASTTAGSRSRLLFARDFVEKNHPGACCVYGDTDSIFIDFNIDKTGKTEKEILQRSIDLGLEYGKKITDAIGEYPHELEYEKTFCPLILMSKKRYVGNLYEEDVNYYKRKSMGDASKRRDYAPVVKTIYNGMVEILLNEKDECKAVAFILRKVQDLLNGQIDHKEFIISKTLRAAYKNRKQIAHAVLADRIAERDPGNAPQGNDRVPFVYIECFNKKKVVGENVEDPQYVINNNMRIDYLYYLEHQIMNPVCQILELLVEKPENLFIEAIEQEHHNRKDRIRQYHNKITNQRDISTFFVSGSKKKKEETIQINIDQKIALRDKDKIIEEIVESKEKKLDSWFTKT